MLRTAAVLPAMVRQGELPMPRRWKFQNPGRPMELHEYVWEVSRLAELGV